jgi:hypothetical protein
MSRLCVLIKWKWTLSVSSWCVLLIYTMTHGQQNIQLGGGLSLLEYCYLQTFVLLLLIKFAKMCSVVLLCLLNCITETIQANEECECIPHRLCLRQPWVRRLGVPHSWSTLCEKNVSPLVVNQTPFSYLIHSRYNEYYLHISSRGPRVSAE